MSELMRLSIRRHNGIVRAALVTVGVLLIPLWVGGTAIAQMLVPLLALVFWKTKLAPGGPFAVFGLNGAFVLLFAMSGLLFRRAARTQDMLPARLE